MNEKHVFDVSSNDDLAEKFFSMRDSCEIHARLMRKDLIILDLKTFTLN